MAAILVTTLVALLVSAGALLTYQATTYRAFLLNDATTQADILARTITPALQFDDPQAARENLSLLASRRGIVAAAVYGSNGARFAEYVRQGADPLVPTVASQLRSRFTERSLELFHPIVANGEMIGTVYLQSSYDLAGQLQDYLLILGMVMLLSLIVAGVISVRLQRNLTAPILSVAEVAGKVMDERDFSLRARRTTDDEIAVLVDSFNGMLAEVGRMTQTLEATNRALTEETEERRSAETALRIADQHKDEFLATLAHELRNPLAPVVNALRVIESAASPSDAQRARAIMQRQLAHMVRLVDDLLDVSRITRGKVDIRRDTIELAAVLRSAVEAARPLIETKQHAFELELPAAPVYLHGDAIRLSQVFSNLLNNAAKFTEEHGRILLTAREADGRIEVVLEDNGIGMAPETVATVFDMFTQGTDTPTGNVQAGLGVGLALAKRLVAMHGGTIEACSPGVGHGTTFTVRLDACPAPAVQAAVGPADLPRAAAGRRILLVDDNVDFAESLAVLLRGSDHEVSIAHDGAGAIEAARRLRPEIAFLDIGLPDLSGYELAMQLRQMPETSDTVLVALSGWGQSRDRQRSHDAGFAKHLLKPINFEKIEATVDELLYVQEASN
jgi:two-component system, sensor histidine kinase